MPVTERKLRVFLCHSSHDKPAVRELYQKLQAEGWIEPWLDEENLLPGQDWEYEIEKALDHSEAVIVTLSRDSVTKEGYIQRELRFVLEIALEKPEGMIFILPLRLEECEPPRKLRIYHYVDYFPKERINWAYEKLRKSLEVRAASIGITIPPKDLRVKPAPDSGRAVQGTTRSEAQVEPALIKPREENFQYDLILENHGPQKLEVIKVIRQLTNSGLAEAKTLAETPNGKVLSTVDAESVRSAKSQLEAVGAVVKITVASGKHAPPQIAQYALILKDPGPNKINIIKVIRELTNSSLAEAKTLAETVGSRVLAGSEKDLAMEAKKKFEAAGAVIELVRSS